MFRVGYIHSTVGACLGCWSTGWAINPAYSGMFYSTVNQNVLDPNQLCSGLKTPSVHHPLSECIMTSVVLVTRVHCDKRTLCLQWRMPAPKESWTVMRTPTVLLRDRGLCVSAKMASLETDTSAQVSQSSLSMSKVGHSSRINVTSRSKFKNRYHK